MKCELIHSFGWVGVPLGIMKCELNSFIRLGWVGGTRVLGILLGSFLMVWVCLILFWETRKSIGGRVDHAVMWWDR
jgi:hypothetical protein